MMETNLAIQEKGLELVVSEKTLGSLSTNARQIRDMVKAALPVYDISNYTDDNIDQARKDKAALNKAAKALNAKRLEIEKEFMKPFREFKDIVNETVKLIGECSAKIDAVVRQNEQMYKDRKRAQIEAYFQEKNTSHIDFRKVFNPAWLNKTAGMKTACSEIDGILSRVESELDALKGFEEDFNALCVYYKDTLDISSAIRYGNRLKEQRELARQAEEARLKTTGNGQGAAGRETGIPGPGPAKPDARGAKPVPCVQPAQEKADETLYERAFKVKATKAQIIALGDYMNETGIYFEKMQC